nr:hypothetical protein [Falsiruegeria litorea]
MGVISKSYGIRWAKRQASATSGTGILIDRDTPHGPHAQIQTQGGLVTNISTKLAPDPY